MNSDSARDHQLPAPERRGNDFQLHQEGFRLENQEEFPDAESYYMLTDEML